MTKYQHWLEWVHVTVLRTDITLLQSQSTCSHLFATALHYMSVPTLIVLLLLAENYGSILGAKYTKFGYHIQETTIRCGT